MDEIAELLKTIAHSAVKKRAITNQGVLNEAYAYAKPSSFSRGMRIDLNGLMILLISGTASIDEHGKSMHIGDFRAQMRRTLTIYRAAGQRRRHMARHRPHHLLSAGY